MQKTLSFQVGDFSSQLVFYSDKQTILNGIDLGAFDENTIKLFPTGPKERYLWLAGEEHKNWSSVQDLLQKAVESGLARDSVIAGIGGGVVTDMAAFAASLYMRGCKLVLIPTSFLAMVDAAIGGKTGVDFLGYKNLVGTFYPAHEVRICPELLKSLPPREFLCGLAEALKHGMLGEKSVWELVKHHSKDLLTGKTELLEDLVWNAAAYKVGVVQRDFKEQGERAFLNLGHTFAHGLESVMLFNGQWNHGEAVAWGIARAMDLGLEMGITDPAWREEVLEVLNLYGYRLKAPGADLDSVLQAMKKDKKKKAGAVRFVVQKTQGETLQVLADDMLIAKVLEKGL